MFALFNTMSTAILALAVLLPAAQAHMSIWTPSMYGFDTDWKAVTPLANQPFDQWWFHGELWGNKPNEVMTIPAGGSLQTEIACGKAYTSWGNQPSGDACPHDSGAYHAGGQTGSQSGWWGNSEENLSGCALAIAFKSDASQVRPEDFTVMSVQENCVRQRDTTFEIPANLPACPDGECTCAWFWQGKNSAMEMYMTGFRCNVQGGVVTHSFPSPAPPKRGSPITGPTQPMYWANDNSNLDYWPEWSTKPAYTRAFGWQNGAQTWAFENLGETGGTGNGNGNGNAPIPSASSSSSNSSDSAAPSATAGGGWDGESPSSSSRSRTRTRTDEYTRTDTHWYNHIATPTGTGDAAPTSTSSHGGGGRCKRKLRSRQRAHSRAFSS